MKRVYSRKWYVGEGRGFGQCKEVGKQAWRKIRNKSKKTGEDRTKMESEVESKGKWVQEKWATKEVHGKVAVWLER